MYGKVYIIRRRKRFYQCCHYHSKYTPPTVRIRINLISMKSITPPQEQTQ